MKPAAEVERHWREHVAEWERETGRDALMEALASLPPKVRGSRRVRRNAKRLRGARVKVVA